MRKAPLTNFGFPKFWEVVPALNKIMKLLDLCILPWEYSPSVIQPADYLGFFPSWCRGYRVKESTSLCVSQFRHSTRFLTHPLWSLSSSMVSCRWQEKRYNHWIEKTCRTRIHILWSWHRRILDPIFFVLFVSLSFIQFVIRLSQGNVDCKLPSQVKLTFSIGIRPPISSTPKKFLEFSISRHLVSTTSLESIWKITRWFTTSLQVQLDSKISFFGLCSLV